MSTPTTDGWWQRRDDHWYGLHNRVMLTAVLTLAFVVAVVLALHLYYRNLLRRHQSTRRARTAADGIGAAAASLEPPSTGLHPSVISSLPTFTNVRAALRTAEDGAAAAAAAAECAVCLCALEEGEVARLLPNCNHVFHAGCIDVWLQSHSTCPICRAEAEPVAVASAESKKLPETRFTDHSAVAATASAAAAEGTPGSSKDQEGPSTSRLNASLRRMLSRGRSQRRVQTDGVEDLERQ